MAKSNGHQAATSTERGATATTGSFRTGACEGCSRHSLPTGSFRETVATSPGRPWSLAVGCHGFRFGTRARGPCPCDARGPKTEPVAPGAELETAATEATLIAIEGGP
jgi:hypothetical protein